MSEELLKCFFEEHPLASFSVNLAKNLSVKGVKVNFFTFYPKRKKIRKQGVKVSYFPLSKLFWVLPTGQLKEDLRKRIFHPWLLKTIKKNRTDCLHVNIGASLLT